MDSRPRQSDAERMERIEHWAVAADPLPEDLRAVVAEYLAPCTDTVCSAQITGADVLNDQGIVRWRLHVHGNPMMLEDLLEDSFAYAPNAIMCRRLERAELDLLPGGLRAEAQAVMGWFGIT